MGTEADLEITDEGQAGEGVQEEQQQQPVEGTEGQPQEEGQQQPQQQKMVPLNALHEARAEIKGLKERLNVYDNTVNQFRQEFDQFRNYYRTPQQEPQAPQPAQSQKNFNEDPLGYTREKLNEYEQNINAIKNVLQQQHQVQTYQTQQQQILNDVASKVMAGEREFVAQNPDYADAVNYVAQIKMAELEAAGVTNPMAINEHLQQSAWQLATAALQNGKNPAEAAYTLAKRYGYQPKAQQTQGRQAQTSAQLNTVQQGLQNASQSMRGAAPEISPTFQTLLQAEGQEYLDMWEKVFKGKVK